MSEIPERSAQTKEVCSDFRKRKLRRCTTTRKFTEISESASYGSYGNFRNYHIFRGNGAFRRSLSKFPKLP